MKNLLIIGAGSAGEHLLNEILKDGTDLNYNVIGFLDADEKKAGKSIKGYFVLGNHNNLEEYIKKYSIEEIIIASTSIEHSEISRINEEAVKNRVKVRIIPSFQELLLKEPFAKQLRDVAVEDLLGRETVQINSESISGYIKNKKILVTGAAGSIGSELCRQIIKYEPAEIITVDINENDLYLLELYLKRHYELKVATGIKDIHKDKQQTI